MLDLVNLTLDYLEDWSSGSCVNAKHGPNDCVTDAHEKCVFRLSGTKEGWDFAHCNWQPMKTGEPAWPACHGDAMDHVMTKDDAPAGYPNCYLEAALRECAANTSAGYDKIHACATGPDADAMMKASAARSVKYDPGTTPGTAGHPLWCYVDGTQVTGDVHGPSDKAGAAAWAALMLKTVCTNAGAQGLTLPAACSAQ